MKRFLIAFLFVFAFNFSPLTTAGSKVDQVPAQQETYVWICTGGSAYAYHSRSSCSGLNNCQGRIIKVTEREAIEKYHRRPCKRCYKVQ